MTTANEPYDAIDDLLLEERKQSCFDSATELHAFLDDADALQLSHDQWLELETRLLDALDIVKAGFAPVDDGEESLAPGDRNHVE